MCDATYSNRAWENATGNVFSLREINQMEREMCRGMEWQFTVDPVELCEFVQMVHNDFSGPPWHSLVDTTAPTTFASSATSRLS